MTAMCRLFVRRINKERYKLGNWDSYVVTSHKLKDTEITAFVQSIMPVVLLAMFSKNGPQEAKMAIQHLAPLRPELVIPPLLERFLQNQKQKLSGEFLACTVCCRDSGRTLRCRT